MGLFTKKEEKRITKIMHKLMDYSFGEVTEYKYLTTLEKKILSPEDFYFLKSKRFKIKL